MNKIDWNDENSIENNLKEHLSDLNNAKNITNFNCMAAIMKFINGNKYIKRIEELSSKVDIKKYSQEVANNVFNSLKNNFNDDFKVMIKLFDYSAKYKNNQNKEKLMKFLNNFSQESLTENVFFKNKLYKFNGGLYLLNKELENLFAKELGLKEIYTNWTYHLANKMVDMIFKYELNIDEITKELKKDGKNIFYLLPYTKKEVDDLESRKEQIYEFTNLAIFGSNDKKEINFSVLNILDDFRADCFRRHTEIFFDEEIGENLFRYFPNELENITFSKIEDILIYNSEFLENDTEIDKYSYLQTLLNAYLETHTDNEVNKAFCQHLIKYFKDSKYYFEGEAYEYLDEDEYNKQLNKFDEQIDLIRQTFKISQPNFKMC